MKKFFYVLYPSLKMWDLKLVHMYLLFKSKQIDSLLLSTCIKDIYYIPNVLDFQWILCDDLYIIIYLLLSDSDVFGCQKSGSGRVRVSLTRVRVGFGCQMSGFVRVWVIFVGFSGFSGVEKFLKFWPLLLFLMHFYAWIFFKLQKIYNFEKNNVKKKFHLMKNLVLFGKNF